MRIVIDVDGTLADTVGAAMNWVNRSRGTRLRPEMVRKRDQKLPEIDCHIGQLISFFFDTRGAIDVLPYAKHGIRKLMARGHKIIIVTARPEYLKDYTLNWLWHHDIPFHDFSMSPNKWLFGDLVIDDSIRNVREARTNNKLGLLLMQPWNLWDLNNVTDWRFIPKAVEEEWLLQHTMDASDTPMIVPSVSRDTTFGAEGKPSKFVE